MFSCESHQIFQNAFFAKHIWVTVSAKYLFLLETSTLATKNVSFSLGYFKYFPDKTPWIACKQLFVEFLDNQSAVSRLI